MNHTEIIAKIVISLFAYLLLNSCSKDAVINKPANLPDEIPYSELGSGKLTFIRDYDPYLIDIDKQCVSALLVDPMKGCLLSPDGEMIAYADHLDMLYLINSDGSVYKDINYSNQCFDMISWNPDSKSIVYLDQCYKPVINLYELFVKDTCCTRRKISTFISGDEFLSPFSVSVDENLAFYARTNNAELLYNGLYTMNKDGEDLKCISEADSGSYREYTHGSPQWSPNGERIAYLSFYDNSVPSTQSIITVNMDGNNADTLFHIEVPPDALFFWETYNASISLCWSSDGTKIAFTKLEGDYTSHIYVVDVNTKEVVQVTSEKDVQDYYVSWSK